VVGSTRAAVRRQVVVEPSRRGAVPREAG
jgi:hypothetical protein